MPHAKRQRVYSRWAGPRPKHDHGCVNASVAPAAPAESRWCPRRRLPSYLKRELDPHVASATTTATNDIAIAIDIATATTTAITAAIAMLSKFLSQKWLLPPPGHRQRLVRGRGLVHRLARHSYYGLLTMTIK